VNKNHKFRKLKVWNRSVEYVTFVYQITAKFPREERYGLIDQIRRAAVSITLNIAEGSGAGTDLEYIRFLRMAQRSAYEVIAAFEISINLKMGNNSDLRKAIEEADELSAMIGGLIKSLRLKRSS
jgi:four helix bundle protein